VDTMRRHVITDENTGLQFVAGEDTSVLAAMERSGRCPLTVGCRRGDVACAASGPRRRLHHQGHEPSPRQRGRRPRWWLLACRVYPVSDLRFRSEDLSTAGSPAGNRRQPRVIQHQGGQHGS